MLQGTVRDDITVKLKGESAGQLAKHNLAYDTGFTLAPGTYTLKFLARENATGKMGTFEAKFVVPDLTAEQKYLPISSVVLCGWSRRKSTPAAAARRAASRWSRPSRTSAARRRVLPLRARTSAGSESGPTG